MYPRIGIPLASLLACLLFGLAAGPAGAQPPAPEPAPIPDGLALQIARPRAAVLSLHDSAVETFLLPRANDADSPIRIDPAAKRLRLHADYEALFLPLTAGWARHQLAIYRLADSGEELLAEDRVEVVDFGPARHRGRLLLDLALRPGLHRLVLVGRSEARAVGVQAWTRDEDRREIWVLIPDALSSDAEVGAQPMPSLPNPLEPAAAPLQSAIDPSLPVGGLAAGSQRGVLALDIGGAIQFEAAPGQQLTVRAGQALPVWTDYELWWSEGATGDASVRASVHRRAADGSPAADAVASHRFDLQQQAGPHLADGNLRLALRVDAPGRHALVAVLETQLRVGDQVFVDRDLVPFTLVVVGDPPDTGAIAGRVLGRDDLPLEGVQILAHDANGQAVGRAQSNAEGRYRIEALVPGRYRLQARPGDLNYLPQWYEAKASIREADPVAAERGQVTGGIDFALTPGGIIGGRVTDAQGQPLAGIEILAGPLRNAVDPDRPDPPLDPAGSLLAGHRARTNDEGYYRIHQLPAGRYWVRASDPQGRYQSEYFDDRLRAEEADPVLVEAGRHTAEIDFELMPGGAIAGRVLEDSPLTVIQPLAGMRVEARPVEQPDRVAAVAETGRDGHYRLAGLREGRYLLRASDPRGDYLEEWYEEAASRADATSVGVQAGQTTDGIGFTLTPKPARTLLYVDPVHSGLSAGQSGRIAVSIRDLEDLGSFEAELRWDPEILQVDGVEIAGFLGSSGREVIPVEPEIDNAAGRLRFAAASIGNAPGASGGGRLFWIGLTATGMGKTEIAFHESVLTTPQAGAIEHGSQSGWIEVGDCLFGDFDCNCRVDIRDVMAVVARWGTVAGDPDYDPRFDLDADEDIDIVDVQFVAGLWGQTCTQEPGDGSPDRGQPRDGLVGSTASRDDVPRDAADRGDQPTSAVAGDAPDGPNAPSLTLAAMPQQLAVGQPVEIAVEIEEAVDLAGFELSLGYDPARLRFVEASVADFLSSTGRSVVPLGPIVEEGRVDLGAGSLPGKPAPSGSGRLAVLRFEALVEGEATLTVEDAMTVDASGGAMPISGTGARVEVGETVAAGRALLPLLAKR